MNELDIVRVKETVLVTPWFENEPIEIKAEWQGTIVSQADTDTPCIEFKRYRDTPFLVDLDAANLEVIRRSGPESSSPDWEKIMKTVIDDHHEMLVRLAKGGSHRLNELDVVRVKDGVSNVLNR